MQLSSALAYSKIFGASAIGTRIILVFPLFQVLPAFQVVLVRLPITVYIAVNHGNIQFKQYKVKKKAIAFPEGAIARMMLILVSPLI